MIINPLIIESIVPLSAGLIISLINRYLIPKLDYCCESENIEIIDDDESLESIDSTKTEQTDTSKTSSVLSVATMQPHQVHTVHHYYVHN
jgi:hypothetical protein